MPTREEMQEIETSSRLYREGDVSYMTANVLYQAETTQPKTTAVTFMRTPRAMVTPAMPIRCHSASLSPVPSASPA